MNEARKKNSRTPNLDNTSTIETRYETCCSVAAVRSPFRSIMAALVFVRCSIDMHTKCAVVCQMIRVSLEFRLSNCGRGFLLRAVLRLCSSFATGYNYSAVLARACQPFPLEVVDLDVGPCYFPGERRYFGVTGDQTFIVCRVNGRFPTESWLTQTIRHPLK